MGGEIVKIKFSTLLFYAFSFFSSVKYVDLDYYQRNNIIFIYEKNAIKKKKDYDQKNDQWMINHTFIPYMPDASKFFLGSI
jgi:hypothetical protein